MEKLLNDKILIQVRDAFKPLKGNVQILFFGSNENCEACEQTKQLLEEVAAAHDLIEMSVYDLQADNDLAQKFNIDKAPGIVIAAKDGDQVTDFGIQFSGIPAGHEFGTLINDIILVSQRDSGLSPQARQYLKDLTTPLHLQVFVTPSCPYCPNAVLLAHQMAMENPAMIRAEGVEATEFPDLANQFNVMGVPQTVINAGAETVVGAVPEQNLLAAIMRAVQN